MITYPENVCWNDGYLRWSAVDGAHGYNVHMNGRYVATVEALEYATDEAIGWTVSSWTKESHSPRSKTAVTKIEPEKVVFEDKFENLDNWRTYFPYWDWPINNELQEYVGQDSIFNPFSFGEDGLTITAKREVDKWYSGVLTGPIEKSYLYGYFEAEIKLDIKQGMWPAFWLLNTKYVDKRPEIDIVEVLGHEPNRLYHTYHTWTPDHSQLQGESVIDTSQFHKFGLLWEPNRLTWYVDGLPVFTTTENVSSQPMYPIINLAVGGNWVSLLKRDIEPDTERGSMTVRNFRVCQDQLPVDINLAA